MDSIKAGVSAIFNRKGFPERKANRHSFQPGLAARMISAAPDRGAAEADAAGQKLPYSRAETWDEATNGCMGLALDRCEYVLARPGMAPSKRKAWEKLQMRIVAHILATFPPLPGDGKRGE
jgi:hypothetical protein